MRSIRAVLVVTGCLLTLSMSSTSTSAQDSDGRYRVFRPDGPGPHPAVAFLSGCSGFAPSVAPKSYDRVAEQLVAQGFVVIFVDYLGRRGLQSCARAPITPADAAKDLVAATGWLRSQPFVDTARITAMGWSYGGGAVLTALGDYTAEQLGIFRAVVYYPSCRSVQSWKVSTPVLMLLGADDDVAPGKVCQAVAKGIAMPDAVKTVIFPGALHAFDVSELPAKTQYQFGTIGHHPQAAAAAWEEVQRFLKTSR